MRFFMESTMSQTNLTQREIDTSFKGDYMEKNYPPLMTIGQVGKMLQLGRSTLYRKISDGSLESAKTTAGQPVLYYRDEVLKWYFRS